MNFWEKKEAKRLFQELPCYDKFVENHVLNVLKTLICYMHFHFIMNWILKKYQKHLKNMQEVIYKDFKNRLKRSFDSVRR